MEKIFKPVSGFLALIIATLAFVGGIVLLVRIIRIFRIC